MRWGVRGPWVPPGLCGQGEPGGGEQHRVGAFQASAGLERAKDTCVGLGEPSGITQSASLCLQRHQWQGQSKLDNSEVGILTLGLSC